MFYQSQSCCVLSTAVKIMFLIDLLVIAEVTFLPCENRGSAEGQCEQFTESASLKTDCSLPGIKAFNGCTFPALSAHPWPLMQL